MRSFEAVNLYFRRAADQLELSQNLRSVLMTACREVQVQIPVHMDDRSLARADEGRPPLSPGG
jgi:glutamate dehydrogenase (NAD(P)+)